MSERADDPSSPILAMHDVGFHYPGSSRAVLADWTMTLAAGERCLIRGRSGAGKSTLLSLAAGVTLATTGCVRLLGRDWREIGPAGRDRRRVDVVGYLFQQFNLLPYLNVIDNVLLPCRFSRQRAIRARGEAGDERTAAERLLGALGIEAADWRRPSSALSVGQQQRVAAARALIGEPALVIADEPTSALDDGRRDDFMRLLIGQCDRSRCALLFVSHDGRLAGHFDRVLELPALADRHGPSP